MSYILVKIYKEYRCTADIQDKNTKSIFHPNTNIYGEKQFSRRTDKSKIQVDITILLEI
jgi:hypothetical protein